MTSANQSNAARPEPQKRSKWRIIFGVLLGVATPFLGLGAFWWYIEREMSRVTLVVVNRTDKTVEHCGLRSGMNFRDVVGLGPVPPHQTEEATTHIRTFGPGELHLDHADERYGGEAGSYMDDDGPYVLTLVVSADGVTVTKQYNEGPSRFKLERVSATQPTG